MRWLNLPWLGLVLPVLAAAVWAAWRHWRARGLVYSQVSPLAGAGRSLASRLRGLPWGLRLAALVALGIAVLRPQVLQGEEEVKLKGINLMLVTDLSGSMVADDLKPDRITAEKKVLTDFIRRMPEDPIGLVVFGAKSFTQSPLTTDHEVLISAVQGLDLNTVDADGTAIGDGLLTAVNRLKDQPGQTNVIVLSTDGTNNRGEDPVKAAEIAAAQRIRIYAIGIGAQGGAPIYTTDPFGVKQPFLRDGKPMNWDEPNDAVLEQIAAKTGGDYFRAADEKALEAIYANISRLIKDEKKRRDPHYRDLFGPLVLAAAVLLLLEALLAATRLRSLT